MCKHGLVSVPFNDEGIKELDDMADSSQNFVTYIIEDKEYHELWRNKIFHIINYRFGLMIDECESEEVTAEQLKQVYEAINIVPGVFMKAVDEAIKYGTKIYLDL